MLQVAFTEAQSASQVSCVLDLMAVSSASTAAVVALGLSC